MQMKKNKSVLRTLLCAVALLGMAGCAGRESASPHMAAYKVFLQQYEGDQPQLREDFRFDTAFIDDDDIPELLVFEGCGHPCGAAVFQYFDGEVVPIGSYGSNGEIMYIPEKNIIISEYTGSGLERKNFYQIKEGKEVLLGCLERYDISETAEELFEFFVDDVKVTKEEYDKKYQELSLNEAYPPTKKCSVDAYKMDNASLDLVFGMAALGVKEQEDAYQTAYKEFLRQYAADASFPEFLRYDTAFIDDDDIPELLIFEGNSHASGVDVYSYVPATFRIFSAKRDSVKYIGTYGSMGAMRYISRKNVVSGSFTGMGEILTSFYTIKDGEEISGSSLRIHDAAPNTGRETLTYYIDDLEVTKEEYDKKYKELSLNEAFEFTIKSYDNACEID